MGKLIFPGILIIFSCFFLSCNAPGVQEKKDAGNGPVGGGCDGCELMYVGMPEQIAATDTSPGWNETGKKLVLIGTVYLPDGRTPAPDVIIYYWQTDNEGYYSPGPGMDEKAKRHGHIRGWVKTGKDGRYSILTIRPAPYPNEKLPAHIHFSVKEPGINEYYTDDVNFEDDTLLTTHLRKYPSEKRGGSGIVTIHLKDGVQAVTRDVFLGMNIPGYLKKD